MYPTSNNDKNDNSDLMVSAEHGARSSKHENAANYSARLSTRSSSLSSLSPSPSSSTADTTTATTTTTTTTSSSTVQLAAPNHHQYQQNYHHQIMARSSAMKQKQKHKQKQQQQQQQQQHQPGKQLLIVILFLIGLTICVTSLICILMLPSFVTQQISKKLVLKNNSLLLERWSKPNVPMYFKVWLFDVQNAREVLDKRHTKPRVQEIGPFVFNLRRQKDVISFAGDNLYYTERKVYHFNRELSCCAINTSVTIPNIPLVAVVDRALGYNLPLVGRFVPRLINRAIQSLREQLFVRKQVREILFDGYDVELLRMVSRVGSLVGLPQQSQKFALLKGRNNTWRAEQDGVWAINTGARDRRQFGRVSSWNSYKRLPFWPAPQCNVINGSDGTLFPPPIKRAQPLYIFNQELCRTVNLVFERPSDVRSIAAYRFVLNPMNFAHTMTPSTGTNSATPVRLNPTFQNSNNQDARPNTATGVVDGQTIPVIQRTSVTKLEKGGPKQGEEDLTSSARIPATSASEQVVTSLNQPTTANLMSDTTTQRNNNNNDQDDDKTTKLSMSEQEKLVRAAQEAAAAGGDQRAAVGAMNPQTCFCDRKTTNLNGINVCEFDGLIDLSRCSKQAQVIFGSMPHFHNSDRRLAHQVLGLQPNASKHTTYLDIEPNTGLVLGGKRRVQLNVIIKHNNEIDGFENINDMLVPIVWFEESALIPEESAQKFKSLYTERIRLVNWTLVGLFVVSLALLAIDARLFVATNHWGKFTLLSGKLNKRTNAVEKEAGPNSPMGPHHSSKHSGDRPLLLMSKPATLAHAHHYYGMHSPESTPTQTPESSPELKKRSPSVALATTHNNNTRRMVTNNHLSSTTELFVASNEVRRPSDKSQANNTTRVLLNRTTTTKRDNNNTDR